MLHSCLKFKMNFFPFYGLYFVGILFQTHSKYECSLFDAGHKAEIRKTQFPADLAKAFEMGKMIAS